MSSSSPTSNKTPSVSEPEMHPEATELPMPNQKTKPGTSRKKLEVKASLACRPIMKIIVSMAFLIVTLQTVMTGTVGTFDFLHDKFDDARSSLDILKGQINKEQLVRDKFERITAYPLQSKYGESYGDCLIRGISTIDVRFFGKYYIDYPDLRDEAMTYVTDNCGRLLFTPQVSHRGNRFRSDIEVLRNRAWKLVDKINTKLVVVGEFVGDWIGQAWGSMLTKAGKTRMPKMDDLKTAPTDPDRYIEKLPGPVLKAIVGNWFIYDYGVRRLPHLQYISAARDNYLSVSEKMEELNAMQEKFANLKKITGTLGVTSRVIHWIFSLALVSQLLTLVTWTGVLYLISEETLAKLSSYTSFTTFVSSRKGLGKQVMLALTIQSLYFLFTVALYKGVIPMRPDAYALFEVLGFCSLICYLVPNHPPWPTYWEFLGDIRELIIILLRPIGDADIPSTPPAQDPSVDNPEHEIGAEVPITPTHATPDASIDSLATIIDNSRRVSEPTTLQEDIAALLESDRVQQALGEDLEDLYEGWRTPSAGGYAPRRAASQAATDLEEDEDDEDSESGEEVELAEDSASGEDFVDAEVQEVSDAESGSSWSIVDEA